MWQYNEPDAKTRELGVGLGIISAIGDYVKIRRSARLSCHSDTSTEVRGSQMANRATAIC